MMGKTPSVTTGEMPAVQTKAASVKRAANLALAAAKGLYDPRNEHDPAASASSHR